MRLRSAPSALDLDFARHRRPPSLTGWLLLAFGVAASLAVLQEYDVLETRVAEEAHRLERARRGLARQSVAARPVPPPGDAELKPALAVADALRRDWPGLLAGLEQATDDPGVALLELEQDGTRGALRLAGQARALTEVFALVSRLEAVPGLREVRLASYGFHDEGAVQVVDFSLQARWELRR